ncbi:MAG: universal stress protein, partial [Ferruginibacter sp.]|nr:universal stress protein [Ferruginibacter sp.]
MKKIIFASDGKNFPKGAFEFIKELQQTEPVLLTGAFLHSLNFEEFLPGVFAMYASPALEFLQEEKNQVTQTIRLFEDSCQRNNIEYRVHEQSMNWKIDDLAKETRFADLMVLSEELFC